MGFNSMANERKTAPLIMVHDGNGIVVNDFPADKFKELKSFAETLAQPVIVPNMIPQPPPNMIPREQIGANIRGSLLEFFRRRKDRVTPKPPEPKVGNPFC